MKKTKILYISYDGATEPIPQSQVLAYLRQINKNGINFCWLSFEKNNSPLRVKEKRKSFEMELLKDNIRWFGLYYHKQPYLMAKIFDILNGIIYGSYLIVKQRIKIVHGRGEVSSFICYFLKRIFGLKFIYDRRGYMADDYVQGGMWKRGKNILYALLKSIDRKLLLSADAVVVLTERIARILVKENAWLADKIYTIPCCVDLDRFKFSEEESTAKRKLLAKLKLENKFIFMYLGSLGTWYMLEEMIDFFIASKDKIPNAHFLILTMSDHTIAREAIARKKQISSDFTILNIPHSVMPEYIGLASVALIFIKPVFSKLSSSPTKFSECLACGVPVIINSNIGDCDELIRKNNIGVVADKFEDSIYRKALDELTALMEDDLGLRRRCRQVAEEFFPLKRGVNSYTSIYLKLLNKN